MNLFYKHLSIYGILPVVGKSIGFFLIPIYTRLFSAEEFGQVELVVSLINLLVYFISLEFYSAVGRYIFQFKEQSEKRLLVSTGLWMTLFTTLLVVSLTLLFRSQLLTFYLSGAPLENHLTAGIAWLAIEGCSTYMSVLPRYTHRQKLYVVVTVSALLIRVLSTIFFVLVLHTGTIGILYGHVCGSLSSLCLNSYLSREYLSMEFNRKVARKIAGYALPLVPGLLAGAFSIPTFYKGTELYFGASALGQLSFALRLTSLMVMFRGVLQNAWFPLLYEHIHEPGFVQRIKNDSLSLSSILLTGGALVVLLGDEICLWLGTEEFRSANLLLPFLCYSGYLQAMTQLRGFGPLVNLRTHIRSTAVVLALAVSCIGFPLLHSVTGLWGVGVIIVSYEAIQYLLLTRYTSRVILSMHGSSLIWPREHFHSLLYFGCCACSMLHLSLALRLIAALLLISYMLYTFRHPIARLLP